MVILQGAHTALALLLRGYSCCGRQCARQGCDVWNPVLDGRFADVRIIRLAEPSSRGVKYQLDFAVGQGVENAGSALGHLVNMLALDSACTQEVPCASGGEDLKSQVVEVTRDLQHARTVV